VHGCRFARLVPAAAGDPRFASTLLSGSLPEAQPVANLLSRSHQPKEKSMRKSNHVFPLAKTAPQFANEFGSRTSVNRTNFPMLSGMAFYRLVLQAEAFREPHWHLNAHELTYCAQGSSLVTVFSNGNLHDTFTIAQGEMFFVPSGYLHAIANTGKERAEFLVAFSHHEPEDFGMSGAVGCMNANVMGNTWGIAETAAKGVATRRRISSSDSLGNDGQWTSMRSGRRCGRKRDSLGRC
jgi:oxalate decarboxylase/phosphoglucose isomerase-like protein (cupin superfamily)